MNLKVGSSRVKQYKSGEFRAFSDLLIAHIPEGSFKLPSILGRNAVKNAPKIDTESISSRTQAEVIHKHCLVACPDAVIKKYNLDSLAADHRDFNHVNRAWANVSIVIYTSTISTDCSFELLCFTCVFGYFSSMSTDYKTAIQMLGWVRNISPGSTT